MLKSQHSKAGYINYLMRFSAITTKHSRNNVRAIANKNYKKTKTKKNHFKIPPLVRKRQITCPEPSHYTK